MSARGVTVRFRDEGETVLDGVDLSVSPGEIVVIAGPSGSGKSTLCSVLAGIIPHFVEASIEGEVRVCGLDTREAAFPDLVRHVSTVFQNPETNLFALKAIDDIAFGPENLGNKVEEIRRRVAQATEWTDSWRLLTETTAELSGGQKQRLAIASSLAILPDLLILDEPTTDLDPVGKSQVVDTLLELRERLDVALVVVEHDLSNVVSIADRLVTMEAGRITRDGPPDRVLDTGRDHIRSLGIRVPPFVEIGYVLQEAGATTPLPLTERALASALEHNVRQLPAVEQHLQSRRRRPGTAADRERPHRRDDQSPPDPIVELRDVSFRYPGRDAPTLVDLDLRIDRGEVIAIVGPNGSGKSTLLRLMMGFERASRGDVVVAGASGRKLRPHRLADRVGYGFQNPDHQLFERTVHDECAFSLRRRGLPEPEVEERVERVLRTVGLDAYADRHPATLSRGEKRRLAVATALVLEIDMLLLDEPTTGQDSRTLTGLLDLVTGLNRDNGTTVILVTHDMDVVWAYATRVVCVNEGRLFFDGPPDDVFSASNRDLLWKAQLEPPLFTTVDTALRALTAT